METQPLCIKDPPSLFKTIKGMQTSIETTTLKRLSYAPICF